MANTPTRFYTGQASSDAGTLYTVPSATKAVIKTINICNTDSTAHTASLYFVPAAAGAAGTAGSSNALLYNSTFAPTETKILDGLYILDSSNDTIQAQASTGSKITINITGWTVT